MKNEILWLIRLGLDQKMFTREQALEVMRAVGKNAELADFAQKLIDDSIVHDVAALETLAGNAMARAEAGPPAGNPLLDDEPAAAPAATGAKTAGGSRSKSPAGMPEFPFAQVGTMGDSELAANVRELLIATGEYGASDLHLSAGSCPFVRKHRALEPITTHVLTEKESLRMNTALLASHQRNIFLERRDYDFALALDADHRYRVNLMIHKWGAAGSYRMVPAGIPKLDDLGLRNPTRSASSSPTTTDSSSSPAPSARARPRPSPPSSRNSTSSARITSSPSRIPLRWCRRRRAAMSRSARSGRIPSRFSPR
jgi:twitching motility protein PilT